MKNGYDHHVHQDIYTYNLSVPKRFTLDVPNQSPPYLKLWLPIGRPNDGLISLVTESKRITVMFFIGPRYTWSLIYVLYETHGEMLLM